MQKLNIHKKILSEIGLYYGYVDMPKGFEIDHNKLQEDILTHQFQHLRKSTTPFPFSKTWNMLNSYVREHILLKYELDLINKETWGITYKPQQTSPPLVQIDQVDLKNSADYTLLYGVHVKECGVRIYYDDNRRKGRSWDMPLKNNKFIMFPSTQMYCITNNQKDSLNFIQTITYEYS